MTKPRPPGRPPLDADDPSVPIHVTLPSKKFEELCARARRRDLSVPEYVRQLIYAAAPALHEKKTIK